MKKSLFIIFAMFFSITASAQFVIYESAEGYGSRSQQQYNNSGYNNYNLDQYYQAPPKPQSQIISTRGYYIKNNQWNSVLLKVKVVGNDVYVVGIKRQSTGWSNSNTKASTTDIMQREIKDNFDYYIRDYGYGIIYF